MAKQMKTRRTNIVTPHAMLLVWNYVDRASTWNAGEKGKGEGSLTEATVNQVEKVIISTLSLKSVKTVKHKSKPDGQFTIDLAPTKNWVSVLAPGSWCALLMSQEKITEADIRQVDPKKLKMLGRIQSVRTNVAFDQNSGARQTSYSIIGEDWGGVFHNQIYLDPLAINESDISVGGASRLAFEEAMKRYSTNGLASTNALVLSMLAFWGKTNESIVQADTKQDLKSVLVESNRRFTVPQEVLNYLNITVKEEGSSQGRPTDSMADIILNHFKGGVVQEPLVYDGRGGVYDSTNTDSVGYIKPDDLMGIHTVWQLMSEYCNPIINEMVCDLDFEPAQSGKFETKLRVFKRVKPFLISKLNDDNFQDEYLQKIATEFTWLPYTRIPIDEVMAFETGTNWRDKYNFAEIRLADAFRDEAGISNILKEQSQIYDNLAFQREGFRPMIVTSRTIVPFSDSLKNKDVLSITKWKYLLKEWYFDTHRLLNGTVTLIGQSRHIKVGENILIPAKIMTDTYNINQQNYDRQADHLLLHVESISHTFMVDDSGARRFLTTINFVRGILVDSKGQLVPEGGPLDKMTDTLPPIIDKNKNTVFGTASKIDPDPDKPKGT